jgi:hypothetical protein
MPRSFAHGDYSLLLAIESASRLESWYRVVADRRNGAISCDCAPFIFNRQHDAQGRRCCQHTAIAALLSSSSEATTPSSARQPADSADPVDFLLVAAQTQWPGLHGTWSIERRTASIQQNPYLLVLVRLAPGNGGEATGVVAFAERHHPSEQRLQAGVAGWAGYAIAAEVARRGGYPLAGQPPEHFRVPQRQTTRRTTPSQQVAFPSVGLADILRVGDTVDQDDGLRPAERAERTLRLFLGETLYAQLERQHFLDVSSVRFASQQRVYRLRRDPMKMRERRVRVFEHGQYVNDYCIVRGQDVPEADHYLGVFLHLLSDEQSALTVVKAHNIFAPLSDGRERENVPAIWHPSVQLPLA